MTLTQIRAPNITHLIYLSLKHISLNFYARTQKLMKLNKSEYNCRIYSYSSRSVLYLRSFIQNLIIYFVYFIVVCENRSFHVR
jgi:hypothetical protein